MAFGSSLTSIVGGAGGGNFVGGALIRLLLDAAQFEAGLSTSEARLYNFGRRVHSLGTGMSRFGGAMARGVTVPILAATAASVKFALDFESAFTRIRANSNLTDRDIDKLRKHILELAPATGKSPQELAEGLYFLASAGLTARQVTQTLTLSAKASAAGFGEVGDIARLTANALKAYAKDGLTAKKVTDVLAAGIREGTAEPDEFANALGRILPIASKANVGFGEIIASLAALSNIGLDVNEGVTAMRGLIAALIAPGAQAKDTMREFGIEADELRRSLEEDGLLGTMRLLDEATNGNIDAQRKIIPNIRALTAEFGVTGQKADQVDAAFRRVIGATGDLNQAFRETKKDEAFQLQQLLADIQVVAIELGTEALPVIKDVAHEARGLIREFKQLSEPVQDNIIKWGLFLAVIGPVAATLGAILRTGGRLITILPKLGGLAGLGAAGGAGTGTAAAAGATGAAASTPWGAMLAASAAVNVVFALELREARKRLNSFHEGLGDFAWDVGKSLPAVGHAAMAADQLADAAERAKGAWSALGGITRRQATQIQILGVALENLGGDYDLLTQTQVHNLITQGDYRAAIELLKDKIDDVTKKHGGYRSELDRTEDKLADNAARARGYAAALRGVPRTVHTDVHLNIVKAMRDAGALETKLKYLDSLVPDVPPGGGGGGGNRGGGGGSSPDRGGHTSINIDARGSRLSEAEIEGVVHKALNERDRQAARVARSRTSSGG